ncbi:MAG: hypothetical protein HY718_14410, partial [Planctomycetes bacterium]|nr:hypothetical protein [Planctomycetota bacterium]
MKRTNRLHRINTWSLTTACLFVTGAWAWGATPLGTAFTYQGKLELDGAPVNNTSPGCELRFSLWDDPSAGTQLGSTQTLTNVSVTKGLFTVELNGGGQFGPDALNGEARWLEISVACPSGGALAPLAPRQPLTAAPYALQTRGIFVDGAGNVGIGTTSP